MARKMRILSSADIVKVLDMPEVLKLVEQAFGERGRGRVQMPPKSYLFFGEHDGDLRVMPAFMDSLGQAGVKMVNVHPQNPSRYGLPTVMATIVLFNPETGEPLSIMDGTRITAMRTAAAAGVATKYLARPDSRILGLIGAGHQSFYQLQAINLVMKVAECAVYDVSKEKAESLAVIASRRLNLNVRVCASPEEAVRESDVVVTVTPSSSPIVKNEWVTDGMHLNCVGADAPGKQELETGILKRARIIIDDWEQASHSGEINVSVTQGVITRSDVIGEIGDIIAGSLQGRTRDNEITLFDTTGLAIQDVVCAWKAYEMAERKGLGVLMDSLGK